MIALVDGDVIAFHACPPRGKKDPETGKIIIELDDDGKRIQPVYTPAQEEAYIEEAWTNFTNKLNFLVETLFVDDMLIGLSGVRNFRQDLFHDYKVHRSRNNATPNTTVPILRQRAIDKGYAISAVGYEADDLIRIWAEEARAVGQDFVIASIDKDLLCIEGTHYLMHKGKEQIVAVSKEEALRHYYAQILSGDPTDNIPGVPGIGPKTAVKLIAACDTEEEMQEVVLEKYCEAYIADDWVKNFMINAKLIHILRTPDDYFNAKNWPGIKDFI